MQTSDGYLELVNITAEHEEDNRRCFTGFKSKAKLFLFSFVWDLDIMQMQLCGLLQLIKCQNVLVSLDLQIPSICNLAFVNRSVNIRLLNTRDTWLHVRTRGQDT